MKRRETNNVVYVGLDVDSNQFHGSLYHKGQEKTIGRFVCKANFGLLMKRIRKLEEEGYKVRVCYEAGFLGYTLWRQLTGEGILCEVIAPSLAPKLPGLRKKTDRLDADRLAQYHASGLLTVVHVPDEEDERVRTLIRTREYLVKDIKRLKQRIVSLCHQYGIDYRGSTGKKHYWTKEHLRWLRQKIKEMPEELRISFESLMRHYESIEMEIEVLNEQIEQISRREKYKEKVEALEAFRGMGRLRAMAIVSEVGDIDRFSHPMKMISYAGLDVSEYSSGGKERKGGITKAGNKYLRTVMIEACQTPVGKSVSRRLKKARQRVSSEVVDIVDRCERRLRHKAIRLWLKGKARNKVKVACAREMLCFVWEVLKAVS